MSAIQLAPLRETRPKPEVADIVRAHGEAFARHYAPDEAQRAVLRAIVACRTAALGGHVDRCDQCDYSHVSYHSCRNRHCPKCQGLAQAAWLERQKTRILPTHYFHVVFTVPAELHSLARRNPRVFYELLFGATAKTLLELGRDPRRLGAQLGFTAVLHTWTRELLFHPHVHCIVTGGGLDAAGRRWVRARRRYLLPVKVLSRLFRGKLLAAITRARRRGKLDLGGSCAGPGDDAVFREFKRGLFDKEWVVYAKRPFAGAEQVYAYLGRYTHRVGISNHRLEHLDENGVTFRTKAGRCVTVHPEEFLRRLLLHVLPKRFVKIRHFGLMAARSQARLSLARGALGGSVPPVPSTQPSWRDRLFELTGHDLRWCPSCHRGHLESFPLDDQHDTPSFKDTS